MLSKMMLTAERSRALEEAASRFLRKRGFCADGRPKREKKSEQYAFEHTCFVSTPTNGRPGWRLKKR